MTDILAKFTVLGAESKCECAVRRTVCAYCRSKAAAEHLRLSRVRKDAAGGRS